MRPVIGIGAYPRLVDTPFGPTLLHTVSRFYVRAIELAGGVPVILPVTEADRVGDALAVIHGVLLTGGGDVQPALYGADPKDCTRGVNPERDAFEIALLKAAVASGRPVLGVCRGMQLMNVALGGTLHQDIYGATGQFHYDPQRWRSGVHRVKIEPHSHLAGALGVTELPVNSVHSQGIDRLAPGVRAVARAEDDSIEAIEVDGPPLLLGVQWHPELMEDQPEHGGLFSELVEQARRFAALA